MKSYNKIDYNNISSYKVIDKNFYLTLKWTIIVLLKTLWVYLRQFKYDPRGFFLNFFTFKNQNVVNNKIHNNGFETLNISKEIVKKIKKDLDKYYANYLIKSKENKIISFDDTLYKLENDKFLKIKNLLLSDSNFIKALESIAEYKQIKKLPKINFISLQLTSSIDDYAKTRIKNLKDKACEYMHIDSVVGQIKILVYLSKVNVENGPTSICENTHNKGVPNISHFIGGAVDNLGIGNSDEKNMKAFKSLPSKLQIKNSFGSDLDNKSDLANFLISREKKITGDEGTIIAFDPLSVHRGGLISEGFREILQVSLSLK